MLQDCLVCQVITASWKPQGPRDDGFRDGIEGSNDLDTHIGIARAVEEGATAMI